MRKPSTAWHHAEVNREAALDALERTGRLVLENSRITAEDWAALAADARLARARALRMSNVRPGGGPAPLLASPHLGALEEITLRDVALGDDGLRALAASPVLATVRTLDIRDEPLSEDALRALVASPHTGALRVLVLHNVGGAFAPLAGWPRVDALDRLDLRFNDVSDVVRHFYDGGDLSTPSYSVDPDPTCQALRRRLGARLLCDQGS